VTQAQPYTGAQVAQNVPGVQLGAAVQTDVLDDPAPENSGDPGWD